MLGGLFREERGDLDSSLGPVGFKVPEWKMGKIVPATWAVGRIKQHNGYM